MPNLNIEISEELLRAIRVKCAQEGVFQKDWVVQVLEKGVGLGRKGDKKAADTSGEMGRKPGSDAGSSDSGGASRDGERNAKTSAPTKTKKLTAEEFQKLPASEKLQAQREGRY